MKLPVDIRYSLTYNIEEILTGIREHMDGCGYETVKMELVSDKPYLF